MEYSNVSINYCKTKLLWGALMLNLEQWMKIICFLETGKALNAPDEGRMSKNASLI